MICAVGLLAALIAVIKFVWPRVALPLAMSLFPITFAVPLALNRNPVTVVPGAIPRFPKITVLPLVLSAVILEPAKTA